MRVALALVVLSACTAESTTSEDVEVVAKKKPQQTVTKIRENGQSVDTLLNDLSTGTLGVLHVARDEINNTTAIDFSYATPTSDPDFVTIVQGAGEIPNSAYTQTDTTAHLQLAAFPVTVCTVNIITTEFTCTEGAPIAFDLTWQANGFSIIDRHTKSTEVLGPVTTKFKGDFVERSALINGTWNGNTAVNMSGHLTDTQGSTVIREITVQMN